MKNFFSGNMVDILELFVTFEEELGNFLSGNPENINKLLSLQRGGNKRASQILEQLYQGKQYTQITRRSARKEVQITENIDTENKINLSVDNKDIEISLSEFSIKEFPGGKSFLKVSCKASLLNKEAQFCSLKRILMFDKRARTYSEFVEKRALSWLQEQGYKFKKDGRWWNRNTRMFSFDETQKFIISYGPFGYGLTQGSLEVRVVTYLYQVEERK